MFGLGADIGIDLGTAYVLIYVKGKGIVLREPSVVAIREKTKEVIAVGEKARKMQGRTPANIITIRPLRHGVISDCDATEQMLKYFIRKAIGYRIIKPNIGVCVPSGVTEVEKRAVEEATRRVGARFVDTIEEPIAAAIGAGIDISKPYGSMVVDIGGGTTDIAVISLGGAVVKRSLKVAGDNFDETIVKYMRKKYNMLIGETTAEEIKIKVGSVYKREYSAEIEVKGRNLVSGLPKNIKISSEEIQQALEEPITLIIEGIKAVLEETPPELSSDISDRGIVLTGGGSLINGLDQLIHDQTGMSVSVAEDAMSCVAIGTGAWVEYRYASGGSIKRH